MDAGREGGSGSIRGRCEQDGTPQEAAGPRLPRGRLCRGVTPGNRHRGAARPPPVLSGPLSGGSPGSPALRGGFVKGTIPHPETTQLPPSPGERGCRSAPAASALPGPSAPSGQREAQRPGLWEPGPRCAKGLSPAPGQPLATRGAAATVWQRSLSRRPRAKPGQFQGTQSTYGKLITLNSSKGYRDRK